MYCYIVGIELHGRSSGPVSARYDHFVGAAELALVMQKLELPPSHFFAAGAFGAAVTVKFSLICPELVLSMAVVGARGFFAEPTNKEILEELTRALAEPEDQDEFNEALESRAMIYLTEPEEHPEMADLIMGTFLERYGPNNLVRMLEVSITNHRHPKLLPEHAANIKQPFLLMHGQEDLVYPIASVEEVAAAVVNSADAEFHVVEGGPHMSFLTHAEEVVPIVISFLHRQAHLNSDFVPIDMPRALARLCDIAEDKSVGNRDPYDTESFTLLDEEELSYAQNLIDKYSVLEQEYKIDVPVLSKSSQDVDEDEEASVWTYSTRHEYTHMREDSDRFTQKRPSIVEELLVLHIQEDSVTGYKSRRASTYAGEYSAIHV